MKTEHTGALRAIAKITTLFGVRGEMKLFSYARTADEFEGLREVFCGADERGAHPCRIASVRTRGNDVYVSLEGVPDRTAAEAYRGLFLFVEEERRKAPPKAKFYVDDLIGCSVRTEEGTVLGAVRSVDALPGQMIYTVRTAGGDVMLPAVPEFVLSVNVETKVIVVRPPEGLFDGEML